MSKEIISDNPTKSNQCLSNGINHREFTGEASPGYYLDDDELDYSEAKHYKLEQEVATAVTFAKKLLGTNGVLGLNKDGNPNLAYECYLHLQKQYEKHFEGRCNFHNAKQLTMDFRLNWDQKFLDFIRTKIWGCLKTNNLISEPWATADSYNKTYNIIFGSIQADIYRFAANVIDKISCYALGF
jgi:hypothetical protein